MPNQVVQSRKRHRPVVLRIEMEKLITQRNERLVRERTPIQIAAHTGDKIMPIMRQPELNVQRKFVAVNDTSNGECRFTTLPPSNLKKRKRRIHSKSGQMSTFSAADIVQRNRQKMESQRPACTEPTLVARTLST